MVGKLGVGVWEMERSAGPKSGVMSARSDGKSGRSIWRWISFVIVSLSGNWIERAVIPWFV